MDSVREPIRAGKNIFVNLQSETNLKFILQ